jgi:two-component system chemotaxis response regulator CheY
MINDEIKKILVVDDAVTVRLYHRKIIEAMGFFVDEAENGLEAIEKGLTNTYDLFLVDINMPKMNGYQLVQEMRKTDELSFIPVIIISTEAEIKDEKMAYKAGANFYLVKPSKENELQNVITLLIGSVDS